MIQKCDNQDCRIFFYKINDFFGKIRKYFVMSVFYHYLKVIYQTNYTTKPTFISPIYKRVYIKSIVYKRDKLRTNHY